MPTPAPQERFSTQPISDLCAILAEILCARDELIEMVEIQGPVSAMWREPRRYFKPEPDSLLPFPSDELRAKVWPVFFTDDRITDSGEAGDSVWLISEIIFFWQFFELVRREIIPERFTSTY